MIWVLCSYLLGAIPFASLYAKVFHGIDIKKHGSGNSGATNSLRVLGKKAGILVLLADLLKGYLPVLICKIYGDPDLVIWVGLATILGHIFSVFMKFKGGKGVATSLGVILAIDPILSLIAIAIFIAVVYVSRFVSLGSIIGSLFFLIGNIIKQSEYIYLASFLFLLLCFTHRKNIKMLFAGKENKI